MSASSPASDTATPTVGARKYFGKYRGTVVLNIDPMQIGRVMVMVPDVGTPVPGTWAMPCVPVAGIQSGVFVVPPLGAGVWVEFERGDPDHPIWVGGFWGLAAEVPALALIPPPIPPGQNIVLQTPLQNTLLISDAPPSPITGGIILKSTTGAMIVVNDLGIFLNNGKGAVISMLGPVIDVNIGALTIV
jgi:Type VI secretion system/phage-baseplate injector OB domain